MILFPIGTIDCKIFVNQFLKTGTKLRSERHLLVLEKQRAEESKIQREIQRRKDLISEGEDFPLLVNGAESRSVSGSGGAGYNSSDLLSALKKMSVASEPIDMTHTSSPSLKGFTGNRHRHGHGHYHTLYEV